MASRTLQIRNLDDRVNTPTILIVLLSIDGVSCVNFSEESHHAEIVFDEDITSPSTIARTLEASGHSVSRQSREEKTACCGGCGG